MIGSPCATSSSCAAEFERRDVLAHRAGDQDGRVVGELVEEPSQQVVGQLAGRQREPQPDDGVELAQAADDEIAVGGVRLRVVDVARAAASVDEVRGGCSRRPAGLHVEEVVADDERLLRRGAHHPGGVDDAVRGRLGREAVVASHDDVEVGGRQRGEAEQGAVDCRPPVARQHADGDAGRADGADDVLGAVVGLGGVRGGQLEALEGGGRGVSRRPSGELLDPLEHEAVRRAADLALDGGEVERAGARQRAVEVEEDGAKAERPRAASARAARLRLRRMVGHAHTPFGGPKLRGRARRR